MLLTGMLKRHLENTMAFQFDAATSPPAEKQSAPLPELWNPSVAIGLSFLFSPLFGALMHQYNWRRLERPDKATAALTWAVALPLVSVVLMIAQTSILWSGVINWAMFGLWYGLSGREQVHYVEQHFGASYTRKGWGTPVTIALLASIAMAVPALMQVARTLRAIG